MDGGINMESPTGLNQVLRLGLACKNDPCLFDDPQEVAAIFKDLDSATAFKFLLSVAPISRSKARRLAKTVDE